MTPKLLLFVFLSLALGAEAQILEYKGKSYAATAPWNFISENYALTGTTLVQVAKTDKGGLLKLAVETTNPVYAISGTTYVFLTDNTVITCTDKGLREVYANQIISYYVFSAAEMNKLKATEIQSIHFNIKGSGNRFDSQLGNFTAINRQRYFTTTFDKRQKSYQTSQAIAALYTTTP